MQQIRQAPVREFAVMNGFPLTTDMSAAILQFGQLRRLGLHQVDWQSLRELLVPLAEHCPDIEELWLLDINVPEEGGEVFVEALRSLRLRELHIKKLSPASVEQMLVEALPELAQQSERTLRSLECCGVLGSQRLLSLVARARKLRRLFVNASETKDAKGNHKEVCPDFGGGQEDLLLKVITRCPHLEAFSIDWTRPPPPEDEPGEAERTKALVKALQLGRKLWDMNCINVSFYTGLQYSDGHVFTPQPDSDSDD
ncbi:unnamed protein product [Symbiodinium natans]|uniref:Uncharacterized protein n=1 Tax=Symbiodinium natans TaxID=878477 RepID=A0A812J502_9DINO|nr:unnamed protein product [Symbiodinium natans]